MLKDLCFEIIQKCTNNCMFCSSCASMTANNIIEYDLFEKVIEYLVENGGVEEISISGGEPFLHKDLLRMVALCKSHNIKVTVYTSGIIENPLKNADLTNYNLQPYEIRILEQYKKMDFSYIRKEQFLALKEVGLEKVVFDFQSAEWDIYNQLMGTKDNLTHLLTSMIKAKAAGLQTEVHFIPMRTNHKEIKDILEMCDIGEVDRISLLKFVPQGRGRINREDLELTTSELKEFIREVENLRSKFKVDIRLGIPVSEKDQHLCTAGYDKLSIRYDGLVLPCVAFKEIDNEVLENFFKKNGSTFRLFSIKDRLDMLVPSKGYNKLPICKQVYEEM